MIGGLGEPEQVLAAAWLTGLRSARTRRAYAADVPPTPVLGDPGDHSGGSDLVLHVD